MKASSIPQFDHTIIWRKKVDRPPRTKLSPLVGRPVLPSMRDELINRDIEINKSTQRQRSTDSNSKLPSKRQKVDNTGKSTSDEEMEEADITL